MQDHSILVTANSDLPKCSLQDVPRFGIIKDSDIKIIESRQKTEHAARASNPAKVSTTKPADMPKPIAMPKEVIRELISQAYKRNFFLHCDHRNQRKQSLKSQKLHHCSMQ
jgi:hypothetical protein